jgi:hypothetical protein
MLMLAIYCAEPVSAEDDESATEKESTDWTTTFRDDLRAARRIILENHPVPWMH